MPLPALLFAFGAGIPDRTAGTFGAAFVWVNVILVVIRLLLTLGLRGSYAVRHWTFWLSFTADPVAAVRILLSSLKRPRQWRTRQYDGETVVA